MSAKDYQQDANRDPLTGEPRSHPIGTGVGAAAGGAAAGAAAGTIAGPVGTGIGAAVGAVAGGLAGKATAEKFNPTEAGELRRFIDYTVVDREGDKIGSIDAVWQDHTDQPAYFAVRTGWLGMGKAHVVPAQRAEVNETRKTVRVPFSKEEIKNAPSFDSQDDINEDTEFTISSHYGIGRDWNRTSRDFDAPSEAEFEEGMEIDQTLDTPADQPRQVQGREETKLRLNEEQVKSLGIPTNIDGVYVSDVSPDGGAFSAGLKKGDLITKVNNVSVTSGLQMSAQIAGFRPGDKVPVTYLRSGKEATVDVILKKKTDVVSNNVGARLGGDLTTLDKSKATKYGIDGGVVVNKINADGILSRSRVQPGFIITGVITSEGERDVTTVEELS